ncbi:MAG TPA: HEAT repeat domain-containing protein, partial [Gemmataceae bacterium]|nr:HEAT repeat domain-containing protein [Gemmataceae bacterium]
MSVPGLRTIVSPRCLLIVLFLICVYLCSSVAHSFAEEADTSTDEEVLRAARLPTDGPDLLTLFRKRTPDTESQEHIKTLIAQLGSASFSEREEASDELAACGIASAGLLREAARHRDLEIRRRAKEALILIEENDLAEDVLLSALHVLGRRKPPRMTEVLLAYAPHAASTSISEELGLALSSVALRDGEVDPALMHALDAKSAKLRGVAAEALCRSGSRKQLPAMHRLLRDPDPHVRRRIALALLEARDKTAVPVLIELLAELPLAEAEPIESILLQLAGDTPPKAPLDDRRDAGRTNEARRKYRDAWASWWKRQGDTLDLAKVALAPRWRGYTLAVCLGVGRGRAGRAGCILEYDARGRIRWQMQGLVYPVDAQVLDERRVLVTEYRTSQVTERNHNGDVLRRIDVSDIPLEARRLSNGRTLITTRSRVFE